MSYTPLEIKTRIRSREKIAGQIGSVSSRDLIGNDLRIALDEILDYLNDHQGGGGGIDSASNGLYIDGTELKLGSTLIESTTIEGEQQEFFLGTSESSLSSFSSHAGLLSLTSIADGLPTSTNITLTPEVMFIGAFDVTSPGTTSSVALGASNGVTLGYQKNDNSVVSSISVSNRIVLQTSDPETETFFSKIIMDTQGIGICTVDNLAPGDICAYLKTDYLTNSKSYQFPDNNGTLALVSDIINYTTSNGISESGNNLKLGGDLAEYTIIGGNYSMLIGDIGNRVESFQSYTNGYIELNSENSSSDFNRIAMSATSGNSSFSIFNVTSGIQQQFQMNSNGIKLSTGDYGVFFKTSTVSSSDKTLELPNTSGELIVASDSSVKIAIGTTGERPASPLNGMIRFNSTTNKYEGYVSGTGWVDFH